jgi:hypothetical protein
MVWRKVVALKKSLVSIPSATYKRFGTSKIQILDLPRKPESNKQFEKPDRPVPNEPPNGVKISELRFSSMHTQESTYSFHSQPIEIQNSNSPEISYFCGPAT